MKDASYTKIGVFVLVAMGAATAAGWASFQSLTEETRGWSVFFAESVQGLELGSAVKFRGVKMGTVSAVEVAPDGRHVRVDVELREDAVSRIGLASPSAHDHSLCARLTSVGLTGMKIVQLDAARPGECTDPSTLPFEPPEHAIATRPSTLASLTEAVRDLTKTAPRMAEQLTELVDRLNRLVGDVDEVSPDGPATLAATLADIRGTAQTIDRVVAALDTEELSGRAALLMAELRRTSAAIRHVADRLHEDRGLMARLERASTSMGDAAQTIDRSGGDLRTALDDVSEAARSIRRLADLLERDPDMLLKGRAE